LLDSAAVHPAGADLHGSAAASTRERTSFIGEQLCYGGVSFELLPDFDGWELPEGQLEYAAPVTDAPLAGEVRCALTGDASLSPGGSREVSWKWDGDRAHVKASGAEAVLHRLAPHRYAASARTSPTGSGVSALVTALSSAVVMREGGLVLHAAGIELDGRALLFIGPSGAGKTTACNHAPGASWFARDRAAVYPSAGGWFAWGMTGGDPVILPRSERKVWPLSAVLRVRRANGTPEVTSLGLASAVSVLRESVQSGGSDRAEELRLFDSMTALAGRTPVGEAHTALEAPITELLRGWLGREGLV
jgi:hypothetical protein